MNNRLYRSTTNRMIAGVCGGLAAYLRIDASLVRLFFVLLMLAGTGIGVLVYLLFWIILPYEGEDEDTSLGDSVRSSSQEIAGHVRFMGQDLRRMVNNPNPQIALVVGGALFLLGIYFLLANLHPSWFPSLDFAVIWPSLLILGGIVLLYRYFSGRR
jgi:phage shock protein C